MMPTVFVRIPNFYIVSIWKKAREKSLISLNNGLKSHSFELGPIMEKAIKVQEDVDFVFDKNVEPDEV